MADPKAAAAPEPAGYFAWHSDGHWEPVNEAHKNDIDVVPLYTRPDERVAMLEGLLTTALARLALKGDDADDLRAALEGK